MPQNLQTLPLEVLDVLRFFGSTGQTSAHADEIIERTGLSDRGFGKAIRRLVTSTYLVMDGDQVYRLSDAGRRAVADLLEYDLENPLEIGKSPALPGAARSVERRLVLVAPCALSAGTPAKVWVGFEGADDGELLSGPAPLVVRFSAVHGEAASPAETTLQVENRPVQYEFTVTPGSYTQTRLRVQLFQSDEFGYEIEPCGGLYVDVPVSAAADSVLAAYGASVSIRDVSE
ncbi:MAG: hypothetical protein U0452_07225 [Anaerolineae bacterium]